MTGRTESRGKLRKQTIQTRTTRELKDRSRRLEKKGGNTWVGGGKLDMEGDWGKKNPEPTTNKDPEEGGRDGGAEGGRR